MATWLFMHIPKTAGTSFRQIVKRQYRASGGAIEVYDPQEVLTGPAHRHAPAYIGHFRYGFHHFFPDNCRYVGFMREPVSHAWSHYHFLIEMGKLPAEVNSFERFLQHKYGYNLQLRFISGVEHIHNTEEQALELARENLLHHFTLLVPMEQFDQALLLMHQILDWPRSPVYHRANERPNKPKITEEERALAQSILKHEITLYQDVKARFETHWLKSGLSERDVQLFDISNWTYRQLDPIYIWFKRAFRFDSKNS
jgi:hypothetical protein